MSEQVVGMCLKCLAIGVPLPGGQIGTIEGMFLGDGALPCPVGMGCPECDAPLQPFRRLLKGADS